MLRHLRPLPAGAYLGTLTFPLEPRTRSSVSSGLLPDLLVFTVRYAILASQQGQCIRLSVSGLFRALSELLGSIAAGSMSAFTTVVTMFGCI